MEKICNLEMIRGVLPSEQLPIDPIHLLPSHLSFQTVSDPEHWIEASFPRLVTRILDVGLMSTQPTTASASHTKYNNTPLLYLLIQQIVLKLCVNMLMFCMCLFQYHFGLFVKEII